MLNVIHSNQFKKDFKKCLKRKMDMDLLKNVVATLAVPGPLPQKNRDHFLSGSMKRIMISS